MQGMVATEYCGELLQRAPLLLLLQLLVSPPSPPPHLRTLEGGAGAGLEQAVEGVGVRHDPAHLRPFARLQGRARCATDYYARTVEREVKDNRGLAGR